MKAWRAPRMKFRADTYDQDIDALLSELMDEETIRAYGDDLFAYEAVAAMLGLRAGNTFQVVEGWVVTPEHPDEIDRRIAIAREGKARGESLITTIRAGRFERS